MQQLINSRVSPSHNQPKTRPYHVPRQGELAFVDLPEGYPEEYGGPKHLVIVLSTANFNGWFKGCIIAPVVCTPDEAMGSTMLVNIPFLRTEFAPLTYDFAGLRTVHLQHLDYTEGAGIAPDERWFPESATSTSLDQKDISKAVQRCTAETLQKLFQATYPRYRSVEINTPDGANNGFQNGGIHPHLVLAAGKRNDSNILLTLLGTSQPKSIIHENILSVSNSGGGWWKGSNSFSFSEARLIDRNNKCLTLEHEPASIGLQAETCLMNTLSFGHTMGEIIKQRLRAYEAEQGKASR